MDDQYQQGFERLLSDMEEPPMWEQVSTRPASSPVPARRGHGMLVAAAAFAVTIIAVGAVVFAFRGDGAPVVAPTEATIDHIEISWEQTIDLRCEGMDAFDNGGFGEARIDIWGPNADGVVRVDATAPDGTVQTVVHTEPAADLTIERVWSSLDWETPDADQVYRVARCVSGDDGGTSSYPMSDPPIHPRGHEFGVYTSLPTETPDGSPFDIEAVWLDSGDTVTDGEWRGLPVKLYTKEDSWSDELGVHTHIFETWFDSAQHRFERRRYVSDIEALGMVTTNTEVVKREVVPEESVSFSTNGLGITWEALPDTPSDDDAPTPTTTSTTVPDTVDVAALDDVDSTLEAINRQHALIDDAMQHRDEAEEAIRRERAALEVLEAEADPRASERELERQRAILRVAELQKRQFEAILAHNEAILAQLEERRSELVNVLEGLMAADRAAAEARAAEHAPYVVTEPIGLAPPPALPGNDGASGSGCYPGPGDLPDGIWFGYLVDRDGPTIDFELRCMYFGEAAWAYAEASSTDADGDIVIMDHDTVVRTLGTAADADVWMVTGDAAEGRHEPFSFAHEWTGDESTYASCPGEGCPVWIYINDGVVDAIVQQYLP